VTNAEPANSTATPEQQPLEGESTSTPQTPFPSGLKQFTTTLAQGGHLRNTLTKAVPAIIFYRCWGHYLYHKCGEFTETKGSKYKASLASAEHWEFLKGTVPQDAYVQLLVAFKDVQKSYNIFTTD